MAAAATAAAAAKQTRQDGTHLGDLDRGLDVASTRLCCRAECGRALQTRRIPSASRNRVRVSVTWAAAGQSLHQEQDTHVKPVAQEELRIVLCDGFDRHGCGGVGGGWCGCRNRGCSSQFSAQSALRFGSSSGARAPSSTSASAAASAATGASRLVRRQRSGRPIGHGDGAQPHPKSAQGQCVLLPSCTEGADACKGCNTAVEKGCAMETVRARGSRWFGGGPDKLAGRVETATTTSTAYRGVGMEGCSRHAKVCKTRIRVAKSEAKRNIYGFSDSACDARV